MRLAYLTAFVILAAPLSLRAQPSLPAQADNSAVVAVGSEADTIAQLRAAAKGSDRAAVARLIRQSRAPGLLAADSIVSLQRAVAVCAMLKNENDYASAVAVAAAALAQINTPRESKSSDNAEILYLQTWLTSQVLGDNASALQLAKQAAALSPQDKRIARRVAELTDAVATFGR